MIKVFDKIKQYFDNKVLEYEHKSFEDELKGVCMSIRDPGDLDDYYENVFGEESPQVSEDAVTDILYYSSIDDAIDYIENKIRWNVGKRISLKIDKIILFIDNKEEEKFKCEVSMWK